VGDPPQRGDFPDQASCAPGGWTSGNRCSAVEVSEGTTAGARTARRDRAGQHDPVRGN
jgi:hypothetical protein